MNKKNLYIAGMHCRSCEVLLEEEIGRVPGVSRVHVSHKHGTATVSYDGKAPDDDMLLNAVRAAGYNLSDGKTHSPIFSRDIETYVHILFALGAAFVLYMLANRLGLLNISLGTGNLDVSRIGLVFLVGLTAGISTCAALVGGLVLGVSARYSVLHPELSLRRKFIPHLWFNAGRVIGFGIFGALLGVLGNFFQTSIGFTALLTLVVGLVMVFLGLQLSQVFPRLRAISFTLPKGLGRILGIQKHTNAEYSHRGAFILGTLTFFLPCGFTQAVQLSVIALGSPVPGAIAMSVFALGTMPGLLALGGLGSAVKGTARNLFFALISVVLVIFGFWNVTGGLQLFGVNTLVFKENADTLRTERSDVGKTGVRVIRMTQDATGYHPSTFPTLEAGVPVRLIVDSTESYTCATSFVIPQFGIRKQLKPGENIIEFTPKKSGSIPFSCSMGMYRGVFRVE